MSEWEILLYMEKKRGKVSCNEIMYALNLKRVVVNRQLGQLQSYGLIKCVNGDDARSKCRIYKIESKYKRKSRVIGDD